MTHDELLRRQKSIEVACYCCGEDYDDLSMSLSQGIVNYILCEDCTAIVIPENLWFFDWESDEEATTTTHDELLAICDNYSFKDSAEPVKALRAIIALHNPVLDEERLACEGCGYDYEYCNWNEAYPCANIRAIEKELG